VTGMPSAIGCSTRLLYPYLQKPHSLCQPHIAIRSSSSELALCDRPAQVQSLAEQHCATSRTSRRTGCDFWPRSPLLSSPERPSHCNKRQPEVLTTSSEVRRQPTTATDATACARPRGHSNTKPLCKWAHCTSSFITWCTRRVGSTAHLPPQPANSGRYRGMRHQPGLPR